MDNESLSQFEELIEYKFSKRNLLRTALTHSSAAGDRLYSNERLEFLGDSVMGLVICLNLFRNFPRYLEGDLTKIKSRLVSRKTCSAIAAKLKLPEFTQVGKGMSKTRAFSGSIAAGTLEALIAAIYLDGGFEAASEFMLKIFGGLIDNADAKEHQENFKSLLQQHAQQEHNVTPVYELLDEKGPDHNKCFEVHVILGTKRFPSAWGITKKEAEQKAAFNALVSLGVLDALAD